MSIYTIIGLVILAGFFVFVFIFLRKHKIKIITEYLNYKQALIEVQTNYEKIQKEYSTANQDLEKLRAQRDLLVEESKRLPEIVARQEEAERTLQHERSNQIYKTNIAEWENEVAGIQKEFLEHWRDHITKINISSQQLRSELATLQSQYDAAIDAAKRAYLLQQEQNFYRLILNEEEIDDIKILREATTHLHNQEPLNKVIWKVYYEKPYTDLIGRVFGKTPIVCGIYKITNIQNQMSYVGQAVNIAERWKQHIKRGLGAEAPTQNKLYPIMKSIGPENFTFEIIEACPREKLSCQEDYWQDFFRAKEFGYSIK